MMMMESGVTESGAIMESPAPHPAGCGEPLNFISACTGLTGRLQALVAIGIPPTALGASHGLSHLALRPC